MVHLVGYNALRTDGGHEDTRQAVSAGGLIRDTDQPAAASSSRPDRLEPSSNVDLAKLI